MGRTCAVISCMKPTTDKSVSLFGLPKNESLSKKWTEFLWEANKEYAWKESKQMYICSDHFLPECKQILSKGAERLLAGSSPTLAEGKSIITTTVCCFNESSLTLCYTDQPAPFSSFQALPLQPPEPEPPCVLELQRTLETKTMELEKMNEELGRMKDKVRQLQKRVKMLVRQRKRQISSRKRKHEEDKREPKLAKVSKKNTDIGGLLESSIPILGELNNRLLEPCKSAFPDKIRDFAFQMHYYSPRAYQYARSIITTLPHPICFHRWTKSIQTRPGFLPTAFDFLKRRNAESAHQILYALSVDEIHIRRQIIHTGSGFTGFVNYGDMADVEEEEYPKVASAALFVVATEINGPNKIPLGYILTNGLGADTLAQVITNTILKMDDVNATPISLVFDGLKSNWKAAEILGACMDVFSPDFKPSIPHPRGKNGISILLDASHMFKLLRNLFKDFGILVNAKGEDIKWGHIVGLHSLQEEKGLRAANKLTSRHVAFKNQKMKTGLCVQTFSNSVAVALGVCRELNIPGFQHTYATEEFLSMLDKLFDYLNSTSFGSGYKSAPRAKDVQKISQFFTTCKDYLSSLKIRMPNGDLVKVCDTQRSTAVKGLIVTMTSVTKLLEMYVVPPDSVLKYLPIYKTMQDLIETFFSSLRARFGFNNNPNSFQLEHALKGIMCMKTGSILTGNCVEQEDVTTKISPLSNLQRIMDESPPDGEIPDHESDEEEVVVVPEDVNFCRFVNNVVAYIAGYVGRGLCKNLKCPRCIVKLAAVTTEVKHISEDSILILNRDNGGLFYPSYSLILVCKIAEQVIRQKEDQGLAKLNKENVCNLIVNECVERGLSISLDCEARNRFMDSTDHSAELIRRIVSDYSKVRFHYLAKRQTLSANPTTNRNVCTKSVHFKGN